MNGRVQVILDEDDRAAFRRQARREGKSLSAWLRDAGRRRLAEAGEPRIQDVEHLRTFFAGLADRDSREAEPDWDEHLRVIEAARAEGRPRA